MDAEQKSTISNAILQMVSLESSVSPDWTQVSLIADETLALIARAAVGGELDPYVIKFLDDVDVRRKDKKYGEYQRRAVVSALRS